MGKDERRDLTGVNFTVDGRELRRGPSVPIKSDRARTLIPDSLQTEGSDGVRRTYPSVVRKALEVIGNS